MIKSVNMIKDIGVFKNYSRKKTGIEQDFLKVNYVFAGNTTGKSTFADILKSAGDDSAKRILDRITIPDGNDPQVVIGTDQGSISYKKQKWTNNSLKDHVLVFDTEFIQNNVFDGEGLIGERGTKENFTDFILGDEGVAQAKNLEELKRKQREAKAKLQESVPASQKNKNDAQIAQYVKMEVNESKEDLENKKSTIERRISAAKEVQKNAHQISKQEKIKEIKMSALQTLRAKLTELNPLLNSTYPVSIEEIVPVSVRSKMAGNDMFAWIGQGVSLMADDNNCPFCGQRLTEDSCAVKYKTAFDGGYTDFRNEILAGLHSINLDYDILTVANQLVKIIDTTRRIDNLVGGSLASTLDILVENQSQLVTIDRRNHKRINSLRSKVEQTIKAKQGSPATAMKCNLTELDEVENSYAAIIGSINNSIQKINGELDKAKQSIVEGEDTSKDSDNLRTVNAKIERLNEQQQCSEWKKRKNDYDGLAHEITIASEELANNQSQYLDRCFNKIDNIFKYYGGDHFKIRRGDSSNRGYKKVIGVKLEFCGVSISDKSNRMLFSESDVRALALAVFMAKIACMEESEQENLILVFDDPVTSFDDNRVLNVLLSLEDYWGKVNQTFILSHNFTFSRTVFLSHKKDIKYFTIKSMDGGNGIYDLNAEETFCDDFNKLYNAIDSFNKGNTDTLTTNDLRRFLEGYLERVFIKQNKESYAGLDLGRRIDKLCEDGFCDEEVKDKLHSFRKKLNPGSHLVTSVTVGNLRNFSTVMIQYIFEHVRLSAVD